MKNVSYCVENYLCTGCGICQDVCNSDAIKIGKINHFNAPIIDKEKCNDCGLCFKVCAGHKMDLEKRSKELFNELEICYIGHSTDHDIRYHCAAGGVTSQFLIWLLEKRHIGGAIVTKFLECDPFKAEPFLAKTKEEILSAKSSKYCPVSMHGMATLVKNANFPVAIVGLPCHIQAFRKLASYDKNFGKNVFAYFGLYCSSTKDYRCIDYICKKHKVKKDNVETFAYRDDGCLGNMKAVYKDGTSDSFSFLYAYASQSSLRSYFKPERCLQCIDHFANLADISFGDIHISPYKDAEGYKIGENGIIARSEEMNELLLECQKDGVVELKEIPKSEIIRSQKILPYRKQVYSGDCFFRKIVGKPVVEYDFENKEKLKLKFIVKVLVYKLQRLVAKWK